MAAIGETSFLLSGTATDSENGDVVMEDDGNNAMDDVMPSLIIPITSGSSKDLFVEIFPEEITETLSSTLLQVLKDEEAPVSVWADAALLYIQHKHHARDASAILQAACDRPGGDREEKVRILASAGIAHLTEALSAPSKRQGNDPKDELLSMAESRFSNATKITTLFPMTWVGQGMLNLSKGLLDQARFYFDATLNDRGDVLPALLGKAAYLYREKKFQGAQELYEKAIRLYPQKSGAATRVGFGLACYRLGQVRFWFISLFGNLRTRITHDFFFSFILYIGRSRQSSLCEGLRNGSRKC